MRIKESCGKRIIWGGKSQEGERIVKKNESFGRKIAYESKRIM